MSARFAAVALMLGNVMTALSILGPAGMLSDLADGLSVSIREAGLLMTFGAVVLCFGSPLMTWAASGLERRRLLAAALTVVALGHVATAVAPDYITVLVLRIAMLVIGAAFTPMAASTVAMMVSEKERPGAISFVFLGWALAIAAGLPVVAFMASHLGWRMVFGVLGAFGLFCAAAVYAAIPAGLRGQPLSIASWGIIARNRFICMLLLVTVTWTCGQFVLFPYLGPLLTRLAGGTTEIIGLSFLAMGVMGLLGNIMATRTVGNYGPWRISVVFNGAMFIGTFLWAVGAGVLPAMVAGVALWGFGFAALNSMQQARLVAAAPPLSGATVALNTSSNYVGQGIGSAIGAELFARDSLFTMGYVATAFMLASLVGVILSRRGGPG